MKILTDRTWTPRLEVTPADDVTEVLFANTSPEPVPTDGPYGRLLYHTASRLHDLGYFRVVKGQIDPTTARLLPVAAVVPLGAPIVATTNVYHEWSYRVGVGVLLNAVKQEVATLQAARLQEDISNIFLGTAAGKLLFADVVGHYDTRIEGETMSPPFHITEGGPIMILAGLTIVFLVQRPRGT